MKLQAVLTIAFIFSIQFLSAQPVELDPKKLAVQLNKSDHKNNELLMRLDSTLWNVDSISFEKFMTELENNGTSSGYHFQARFNCLKARQIIFRKVYSASFDKYRVWTEFEKEEIKRLFITAIEIAYKSEDDYLIALVSTLYGQTAYHHLGEIGPAVMYGMNGINLYEKLRYMIKPADYQVLAEILYRVREYNNSINYARKAAVGWRGFPKDMQTYTVTSLNTVALGYHRLKIYDSAFIYYNQALDIAKQINNPVWIGIVSGNMGQIYYTQGKYDTAYALFRLDYETSKSANYYDNAANSLQWAARTNLVRGNRTAALAEVREAFQLLSSWPDAAYLRNSYFTSMQIFREMGVYDSAFYYNNLYSALNDSLEKVVATSSLAISKAKLNDETSRYNIQTLNREKRVELMQRNIIIISIVVLSIITLLIINRKRLQSKLRMEIAEQEKLRMEQEVVSANDQLKMFTENLIEKANLIERLELQVKGKEVTSEQDAIISELSQQTILTEQDWYKFKSLFEKIHPDFFMKLKDRFSDITLAEQRTAALTRLHLTTKQIASSLGISVDSVHKSRQRLRQRFQVGVDVNIEELLANL